MKTKLFLLIWIGCIAASYSLFAQITTSIEPEPEIDTTLQAPTQADTMSLGVVSVITQPGNTQLVLGYTLAPPFSKEKRPTIRLSTAMTSASFKNPNYNGNLNHPASFELGFVTTTKTPFFDTLWQPKSLFGFGTDAYTKEEAKAINSDLGEYKVWGLFFNYKDGDKLDSIMPNYTDNYVNKIDHIYTLGFVNMNGAGYRFGDNSAIRLMAGNNYQWQFVSLLRPVLVEPEFGNWAEDSRLGSGVRFGRGYVSELDFNVYKGFSIYANAKRNMIYPRYLIWKDMGSQLVHSVGSAALGFFSGQVKMSSPYIFPALQWLLESGWNFAYTELSKKKQAFPFNSPEPLVIDEFNIGLQFEF